MWAAAASTDQFCGLQEGCSVTPDGFSLNDCRMPFSPLAEEDDDTVTVWPLVVPTNCNGGTGDDAVCGEDGRAGWEYSTLLLVALCAYLFVAMLSNLISLYKVVMVWNMIVDQQRLDLPDFCRRRRRMTYKDTLKMHLVTAHDPRHAASSGRSCCSICLSDFQPNDVAVSCEDGCRQCFHKDCLFEWMDRSETCPTCRRDMLVRKSRGFFADLSACMGFRPRGAGARGGS